VADTTPGKNKGQPSASSPQSDSVSMKTWIGVMGSMLGAFMAVLDIQITNSSLQQIEGAIGATQMEWLRTSSKYYTA